MTRTIERTPIPRSAADAFAAEPTVTRLQSPDSESTPTESRRLVRRGDSARTSNGERAGSELLKGFDSSNLQSMASALAVVVGLLLICIWLLKRAGPRGAHVVPSDVAKVIGRVPLNAKQHAQLLHVGNKILLVAATPTGLETLGEIDDAGEVQRIVATCQRGEGNSSQAAFDDIFRSFGKEHARGFLDDDAKSSKGGRR